MTRRVAPEVRDHFRAGQYSAVIAALDPGPDHLTQLDTDRLTVLGIALLRNLRTAEARRTLELAADRGDDEATVELGNLLRVTGELQDAAALLSAASARMGGELRLRALRWYGVTLESLGHPGSLDAMEAARQGYEALGDEVMTARITHSMAATLTFKGRYAEASTLLNSAIPVLARELNQRPLLAALCTLVDVQGECGEYAEAAETVERAMALAEVVEDEYTALHLSARHINLRLMTGEDEEPHAELTALAAQAQMLADPEIQDFALSRLADVHSRRGDHGHALRTIAPLTSRPAPMSLVSRTILGMMALRRGDPDVATVMLGAVRDDALRRRAVIDAARAQLMLAHTSFLADDLAGCQARLSVALGELSMLRGSQVRAVVAPELRELADMFSFARSDATLALLMAATFEDGGDTVEERLTERMHLEITTLGHERITRGGVACPLRHPRTVALLTYLHLQPDATREQIASDLWPELDARDATTTLRQALSDLREHVGRDVVLTSGTPYAATYRVNSRVSITLDIERVSTLGDSEQLHTIVASLRGTFLPSVAAQRWARQQRQRLDDTLLRTLRAALDAAGDAAPARRVMALAGTILDLDPSDRVAELTLIRTAQRLASDITATDGTPLQPSRPLN